MLNIDEMIDEIDKLVELKKKREREEATLRKNFSSAIDRGMVESILPDGMIPMEHIHSNDWGNFISHVIETERFVNEIGYSSHAEQAKLEPRQVLTKRMLKNWTYDDCIIKVVREFEWAASEKRFVGNLTVLLPLGLAEHFWAGGYANRFSKMEIPGYLRLRQMYKVDNPQKKWLDEWHPRFEHGHRGIRVGFPSTGVVR